MHSAPNSPPIINTFYHKRYTEANWPGFFHNNPQFPNETDPVSSPQVCPSPSLPCSGSLAHPSRLSSGASYPVKLPYRGGNLSLALDMLTFFALG